MTRTRYRLPAPPDDPADELSVVRAELRDAKLRAVAVEALAAAGCTNPFLVEPHLTARLDLDADGAIQVLDEDGSPMRGATPHAIVAQYRRAWPFCFDNVD